MFFRGEEGQLFEAVFPPLPYDPSPPFHVAKGVSPLETPAFAGALSLTEAFLVRGTMPSSLGEDCVPCSSGSSNTARGSRVVLSNGLRSFYLRVSMRAYQEVRFERIKVFDSSVSRVSIRVYRGLPLERVGHIHSSECVYPTRAGVGVSIFKGRCP